MTASGRRVGWAIAVLVTTLLLWVAFGSVEWRGVAAAVRSAGPLWLGLAVLLNLAILPCWAAQWRLFVPPDAEARRIGFGRVFGVVSVMSTVANSVPFMAGQATGVHLLATRGGTGHATALSVLALDQLTEGAAKLSLLALLASVVPLPGPVRGAAAAVAIGVAALAAVVLAAAGLERRGTLVRPRGAGGRRVAAFLGAFGRGLDALRHPGTLAGGVGLALAMKVAEGGAILAVQRAVGVELPVWVTLLVLASVGLATMVAVAPANLGTYEAAVFGAYRLTGIDPETAAALALLQHAAFLLPAAGTGWLVVAVAALRGGAAGRPTAFAAEIPAGD